VNSSLIQLELSQKVLADKYNYLIREMVSEKVELGIMDFEISLKERY